MDLFSTCGGETVFAHPLPRDPMRLLKRWFDEACEAAAAPNPSAMVLSTVASDGEPSARVVLCKDVECEGGSVVFYTNYDSRKARELEGDPRAAATFHWDDAGRQARLTGAVERTSEEESDAYFATRPILSQLGAWASRQSEPLATREELIGQIASVMMGFEIDIEAVVAGRCDRAIPRPANWGGYRLWIRSVELWSGGPGRLHERARWRRDAAAAPGANGFGPWSSQRLQP